MAPARQRAAHALDDSRSEASSSTRERPPQTGAKGRRSANTASTGHPGSKSAAPGASSLSIAQNSAEISGINWPSMPLPILHQYRYAYNLPCPSAYTSEINRLLLSRGIGSRSPTAIAARRAQRAANQNNSNANINANANANANKSGSGAGSLSAKRGKEPTTNPNTAPASASNETTTREMDTENKTSGNANANANGTTDPIQPHSSSFPSSSSASARGRVSKHTLASTVRKHFNDAAISEQDAIARFLYKVHEERRGRKFRLRFQPG